MVRVVEGVPTLKKAIDQSVRTVTRVEPVEGMTETMW